jgi:hypothetical protein
MERNRPYVTEDGHILSSLFRNKKDELDSSQVFLTRTDAVQYVIDRLQQEILREKQLFF